jgi:hypothetical protein
MLDVHPAHHAASSSKEFFIHIATIVLGLLIAVGLEQMVEYFHHRHELADVREELRGEREANKDSFARETINWRWETAELKNNLMVLAYLQMHPAAPDEKLPGSLVWFHASSGHSEAAWDAAKNSGVTSLMPREEIEQYEDTYDQLRKFKDFPPSITSDELSQVRNRKNVAEAMQDPAFALTISRMKAAGYVP